MKRIISVFLSITIMFFGSIAYASSTPAIDSIKPAYEIIFSVPIATGEGKISYTPEVEDLEDRGPKSFAVGSNGQFFILDTIGHEVEVFDSNGLNLYTIPTPENKEFFDIEVNDRGHVFLMNDLGEIYEYQDRDLVQIMSFDQTERVSGLSISKNREITLFMDGKEKGLTSGKLTTGRLGYTGQRIGTNIELSNGNKTIFVEYQFVPAGTYPLVETADGETYVLEQEALIGKSMYVETRVGKYDRAGRLIGSALALPLDRYAVQVPYKHIYVTQQGKVYQMVLGKQSVDIYELFFTDNKRTNITPQIVERINPMDISAFTSPEQLRSQDSAVVPLAVTRSTAVSRARDMWALPWYYDPKTMKTPTTSTTQPPQHLANAKADWFVGIPYSWGGMNGIDTGTSGIYINFLDGLNDGKTAGNINTSTPGGVSSTVGVDCSGYISAAYNFGTKYSTSTLSNVFKNITWDSIVQGDIGNLPGHHTWMFIAWNLDSMGNVTGVHTYEATTDGSEDAAKFYDRTLTDAYRYTPMTLK